MIEKMIFNTIGGLGIFMFGMMSMSDSLQRLAGDSLRNAINALTTNRFLAIAVGMFVTATVQSSSVTTVMVVGFVNAGLMGLQQAIGVIMGANIGTTITGWIIAIKVTKYSLPILGIGFAFYLLSKNEFLKDIGYFAFGFGLIFFGLEIMKNGFSQLKADPAFVTWFSKFGVADYGSILMSVAVGALLTMIVQSSSATLGITIALGISGVISFESASALVLGENIGTTITAFLAGLGSNINSRRAARAHMIFNLLGVIIIILIFRPYIKFVHYFVQDILGWASESANYLNEAGERPQLAQYVAMTHTLFNLINTLLWIPFISVLVKIVTFMVPGKEESEQTHLKFITPKVLTIPAIGIENAKQELLVMADNVHTMMNLSSDILLKKDEVKKNVKQVLKLEEITDIMQKEITVYLANILSRDLSNEQTREAQSLIRAADELESIGDYCESLVKYSKRSKAENVEFPKAAIDELEKLMNKVVKLYELADNAYRNGDRTFLPDAKVSDKNILEYANYVRDNHMNRLNTGESNPLAGLIFSDIVVAMRRIRNHTINLAEAYVGVK